jgi:hypothetical protein
MTATRLSAFLPVDKVAAASGVTATRPGRPAPRMWERRVRHENGAREKRMIKVIIIYQIRKGKPRPRTRLFGVRSGLDGRRA